MEARGGLQKRRYADTALDHSVMHFPRNARPFREAKIVAKPCLPLLEADCADYNNAGCRERHHVKPAGLVEVGPYHERETSF